MWSGDHSIPETEKELKRSSLSKDISLFLKSTESGDRIAASHSTFVSTRYYKAFRSCNANVLLTFHPDTNPQIYKQTNYFFFIGPSLKSRGFFKTDDAIRFFTPKTFGQTL